MAEGMKGHGSMANSMEKEFISQLTIIDEKEIGKREGELSGIHDVNGIHSKLY
jgi:hypothetical protein